MWHLLLTVLVLADGAGAGPGSADLTIYNNAIYESDRAGIDFSTSLTAGNGGTPATLARASGSGGGFGGGPACDS